MDTNQRVQFGRKLINKLKEGTDNGFLFWEKGSVQKGETSYKCWFGYDSTRFYVSTTFYNENSEHHSDRGKYSLMLGRNGVSISSEWLSWWGNNLDYQTFDSDHLLYEPIKDLFDSITNHLSVDSEKTSLRMHMNTVLKALDSHITPV